MNTSQGYVDKICEFLDHHCINEISKDFLYYYNNNITIFKIH